MTDLNIETIVALVTGIVATISAIYGLIQKIKAGNYKSALGASEVVANTLMETIDDFKEVVKPGERLPIMKGLGTKLEIAGMKDAVDEKLTKMGLGNKA